eukprot:850263-Rhodomonas_salina.1
MPLSSSTMYWDVITVGIQSVWYRVAVVLLVAGVRSQRSSTPLFVNFGGESPSKVAEQRRLLGKSSKRGRNSDREQFRSEFLSLKTESFPFSISITRVLGWEL